MFFPVKIHLGRFKVEIHSANMGFSWNPSKVPPAVKVDSSAILHFVTCPASSQENQTLYTELEAWIAGYTSRVLGGLSKPKKYHPPVSLTAKTLGKMMLGRWSLSVCLRVDKCSRASSVRLRGRYLWERTSDAENPSSPLGFFWPNQESRTKFFICYDGILGGVGRFKCSILGWGAVLLWYLNQVILVLQNMK